MHGNAAYCRVMQPNAVSCKKNWLLVDHNPDDDFYACVDQKFSFRVCVCDVEKATLVRNAGRFRRIYRPALQFDGSCMKEQPGEQFFAEATSL